MFLLYPFLDSARARENPISVNSFPILLLLYINKMKTPSLVEEEIVENKKLLTGLSACPPAGLSSLDLQGHRN